MSANLMTWQEAVVWLRSQPDRQELVRDCYFDDPLLVAADRFFNGEEWQATADLLHLHLPGKVLDMGAGRGIAAYAFARHGCKVTALEPDPSPIVGRGAISSLFSQTDNSVLILAASGECIPCSDGTFDVVYGRAVLHHAQDLEKLCVEAARVLRPGGVFLATREHVLSHSTDLDEFLANHPLHALYGGENAYLLKRYLTAIHKAGLQVTQIIGPYDSAINHAPLTKSQLTTELIGQLSRIVGDRLARIMIKKLFVSRFVAKVLSTKCQVPGRHYAFLAYKR